MLLSVSTLWTFGNGLGDGFSFLEVLPVWYFLCSGRALHSLTTCHPLLFLSPWLTKLAWIYKCVTVWLDYQGEWVYSSHCSAARFMARPWESIVQRVLHTIWLLGCVICFRRIGALESLQFSFTFLHQSLNRQNEQQLDFHTLWPSTVFTFLHQSLNRQNEQQLDFHTLWPSTVMLKNTNLSVLWVQTRGQLISEMNKCICIYNSLLVLQ